MTILIIGLGLVASGIAEDMAADAVTLRDGKVLLGQLLEPDRRGGTPSLLIRRSWAEANAPGRYEAWKRNEEPVIRRAEAQRATRLAAWRRDRPASTGQRDRITAWLDARLKSEPDRQGSLSPLMVVRLNRADVKSAARKSAKVGRLLRLGWSIGLDEVETMPVASLKQALEGRGFAVDAETPVPLDTLLPLPAEADDRWLLRRAATEVVHDTGNRFLRYQGTLFPEPAPGEPPPAGAALATAADALKDLLGEAPAPDPLPNRLRELGTRGRSGAVVTELEIAPDFSAVSVRVTLWVRVGGADRWVAGLSRSGIAGPGDLPANAGDGLAEDPQVKAAFGLVESLGLGTVSDDLKQKSLAVGAATRTALARARAVIDRDLQSLALPLDEPPARADGPGPKP
ncbi:hypothetical protein TA3x_003233 [Tundrisphaera sp. TA3]|uniref:hypothetical protein n=1 Tax=Tundrisphaera sp. TA3 TaxID=3435775 RepID=UPI003EBDE89C